VKTDDERRTAGTIGLHGCASIAKAIADVIVPKNRIPVLREGPLGDWGSPTRRGKPSNAPKARARRVGAAQTKQSRTTGAVVLNPYVRRGTGV